MQNTLHDFVRVSLEKGLSRTSIEAALKAGGWDEAERRDALANFAEVDFPVPVPKRKPYLSAREAFLYLVMFMTLYVCAFHFGSLVFAFINRLFPDALNPYEFVSSSSSIRMSIASLIVAFPIFLWTSMLLQKAAARHAEQRSSRVKKWLTYITLFISAGIMIADLISLIFNMLGGELTTRFVLKSLVVLVIAAVIFGYYLWDLREEEGNA